MLEDIFTISKNFRKKSKPSYKAAFTILFCSLLCSCAIFALLTGRAMKETTGNIQTFKAGVVEYAVVSPVQCNEVRNSCIFHPNVQHSRGCVPMKRLWMR